jgi:hypothetical protein
MLYLSLIMSKQLSMLDDDICAGGETIVQVRCRHLNANFGKGCPSETEHEKY